jgi:hypothetical protein
MNWKGSGRKHVSEAKRNFTYVVSKYEATVLSSLDWDRRTYEQMRKGEKNNE